MPFIIHCLEMSCLWMLENNEVISSKTTSLDYSRAMVFIYRELHFSFPV